MCCDVTTSSNQFITKSYVDSTFYTPSQIQSNNNSWTGTNTFNSYLPTSTQTPTTSNQLITKTYVDGRFTNLLSANNNFTGSNNFSSNTNTTNLYSNILSINNNNSMRSNNDILEVATSPTSNYLYYNNSSTFGHINTTNSKLSWYITTSGSATIPTINSTIGNIATLNCSSASTFAALSNYMNTSDKLINKNYVDTTFFTPSQIQSNNNTWSGINQILSV